MDGKQLRYRLLLFQLIYLICPSHHLVNSFVLRRRSVPSFDVDDDGLSDGQRWAETLRAIEYLEQPGRYADVEDWNGGDYGGENGFLADPYDNEVAERVMEAIGNGDVGSYGSYDYNFGGLGGNEDDEDLDEEDGDESEADSKAETETKIPLDKSQLEQLFSEGSVQPEDDDDDDDDGNDEAPLPSPEVENPEKTELSKNEVKQIFEAAADKDNEEIQTSPAVQVTNVTKITVGPDAQVVEKLTKTVSEEQYPADGNGDDDDEAEEEEEEDTDYLDESEDDDFWPVDGEKMSKEWMIELAQPEEQRLETPNRKPDEGWSGGRKYKRSMPDSGNFEDMAKQRAVELLKAYIELQDEENQHLTEALNLATMAQTERTDQYIGEQVRQLRLALGDEVAIDNIRKKKKVPTATLR